MCFENKLFRSIFVDVWGNDKNGGSNSLSLTVYSIAHNPTVKVSHLTGGKLIVLFCSVVFCCLPHKNDCVIYTLVVSKTPVKFDKQSVVQLTSTS